MAPERAEPEPPAADVARALMLEPNADVDGSAVPPRVGRIPLLELFE